MEEIENEVAKIDTVYNDTTPIYVKSDKLAYNPGIAHLRIVLMLILSLHLFGVAGGLAGNFIQIVSGFATCAFFIISGFLILNDDNGRSARIARTIGRSALTFLIMLICYFGINAAFYYLGGMNIVAITPYTSKRFWFEFLALNVWPYDIGEIIWYVQAYLYAYIIIFVMNKMRLLKLDWLFFIIFEAISLATSEFAGLMPIKFFGYSYLPQNFFTMALPYIFLGSFLRRKMAFFAKLDNIYYIGIMLLGIGICFAEGILLSKITSFYTFRHFFGMAVLAFAVCVIALKPDMIIEGELIYGDGSAENGDLNYFELHYPYYFTWIYYLLQPVSVALVYGAITVSPEFFASVEDWIWIINFAVCLGISMLIGLIYDIGLKRAVKKKSKQKHV